MTEPIQFGSWRFTSDFASASDAMTGTRVKFTRAERALLTVFVHNPDVVLGRQRLLDAIAGHDADISDRQVDFTINRLRRKLRDAATEPRYIATQYGEGYLWVAQPVATQPPSAGAFIVVGPVRGLHFSGHLAEGGWTFIRSLMRALDRGTAQRHIVALDPDCPSADAYEGSLPQFAVHLNFVRPRRDRLDCAVTLKHFAPGVIVSVNRMRVRTSDPGAPPDTAELVRDLLADIRRSLVYAADAATEPDVEPLTIRHYHASLVLAKSRPQTDKKIERLEARLRENPDDNEVAAALSAALYRKTAAANRTSEREYRAALYENPDDAVSQLLLALAIRAKYTFAGRELLAGPARHNCGRDEAEIETLVMSALPKLQDNHIFSLEAAKLLYFANKAHHQLALELVDRALSTTTTFGTTFSIAGQLYAWEARIDEALAFFDQALELAPEATDFRLYVQVLQCFTLSAAADYFGVAKIATDMYKSRPTTRLQFCLAFAATDAFDLSPTLEYLLDGLDLDGARGHLRYLHYLLARHFKRSAHRQNIMRRPLALLVDRLGEACIPDEVGADMPTALRSRTGWGRQLRR